MKIYLILLFLIFSTSTTAAVYKFVDEQGNIVFSDRKREGATEQELSEPSIVPVPKKKEPPKVDVAPVEKAKPTEVKYDRLIIKSPSDDQVVRNNAGNVAIVIESTPQYGAEKAHRFIVYLDGKKLKNTWTTAQFSLMNVDRGSHRLKVAIFDSKSSRILISSEEIRFHLQRFSIHRAP